VNTDPLVCIRLVRARRRRLPRALLPVVLPAALVPLYLRRSDPPLWRKLLVYLRAALRGRI
jgi:hypothetical protein